MITQFSWSEVVGSSPIMFVIIGCSVVTLGIAVERAYYFWKRRGDPDGTLADVLRRLRSGQVKEASWACETSPHPIGQVALQIFKYAKSGMETLEEQMQIAMSQQKMLLERNLAILGTMAVVAPLIGLLGTVWGIMRAFSDMALTGSAAPSVVAAGVAEALITTAAGLVIAIPALMLYNHFTQRMNVMLTVAENHARNIRSALIERGMHGVRERDREERSSQTLDTSDERLYSETPEPDTAGRRAETVETAPVR
jgi:biopolymer transport protein ExbB